MKKFKYIVLPVLLIYCSLHAALVSAQTQYVSDQLEVTLRRGPTLSHAVLRMLKTGTAVEVLEVDAASGHTRVKTQSGVEGWILSRYLISEPTARMQLEKLLKDSNHAGGNDQSVVAQLKTIHNEYDTANKRIAQLEGQNKQLEQQLASIKQTAANVLAVDEENKKMRHKLAASEERLNALQMENVELQSDKNKDWFFAGAIVLVGGLILGLIVPHLGRRRNSRYGDFG